MGVFARLSPMPPRRDCIILGTVFAGLGGYMAWIASAEMIRKGGPELTEPLVFVFGALGVIWGVWLIWAAAQKRG